MNELAIELKADAGKFMYQQIYEYIRNEIREGKLQRNEKLPSTRSLAEYLQIARSTVDTAYAQLLAEGYIEAKPCRGYYVCGVEELFDLSEKEQPPADFRMETVSEAETDRIKYDFSPHAITMKHFPYATWKRITKEILVDANSEMFALGDAKGDPELRTTIGRYLHSARGVVCRPEQIVLGAGNDFLLMLLEKLLGRQLSIAMENPTYGRAYRVFRSFSYDIRMIPMDENGMSVRELVSSGAKAAYVMPSHQYPSGVVMPIGRRLELLQWARQENDRFLIEDDYDSEFRYKGKPIPALQASDSGGKVIYMGTFSKSIAPAIRVSYMVLPPSLLEKYEEKCGFYASTVSRIDQRILNEFIRNGHFERYLNKMRKIYKEKHDFLIEQLKGLEKGFLLSGENAGLHVLLTSKRGVPEEELLAAAKKAGVKLHGLSASFVEAPGFQMQKAGTVLLGYGGLSLQEIGQGVGLLKEAFRNFL